MSNRCKLHSPYYNTTNRDNAHGFNWRLFWIGLLKKVQSYSGYLTIVGCLAYFADLIKLKKLHRRDALAMYILDGMIYLLISFTRSKLTVFGYGRQETDPTHR
ncbi:uncharacterized protein RJT21DRAFT_115866 [Scheffersomyces amazonensis]|uniref:uncharacterized protein n=1 Tax=Scheffersomyces amazonensis TaxID=1078765 RepID=UPI00315CE556